MDLLTYLILAFVYQIWPWTITLDWVTRRRIENTSLVPVAAAWLIALVVLAFVTISWRPWS